jgi:hypothetical protein
MTIAASIYAQEKPYTQPGLAQPPPPPLKPPPTAAPTAPATAVKPSEAATLNSFFNGKLPQAIGKSKISVNSRLRWEFADQNSLTPAANLRESDAITVRTRFGLTTAPLYGFQGMIEGENITVLGPSHNYNAAGSNPNGAGKTVIADPPTTEINQVWLSYTYTNWVALKGGRQRIALDNHRFVGDVGWRQNMQTFDAATLESKPVSAVSLLYGYLWEVHRVFGDVSGLAPANRDFESDSHLIQLSYSGWKYGRFVGYAYLLDLENPAPGDVNSCATYGGYFAGAAAITPKISLGYRAEAAWQTDYASSVQDYQAEYYNLELGANVKPFACGAGYEALGTDSNGNAPGSVGFRTPLATLHAFNGWADVFLNTPGKGLRDLYAFAQVTLPGAVPVRFVYHKFDADSGGADFGQEFDAVASKQFGKHWAALAKYAYYDGKDAAPPSFASAIDMHKFWLQLEFNF